MRRQIVALTVSRSSLAARLPPRTRTAVAKVRTTPAAAPCMQASGPPRRRGRPTPCRRASKVVELDALNRTIDPCTDFYQFACGGWIASNPMPADRPRWGRFNELQDRNFAILRRILEAPGQRRGSAKKVGDYYAACMDETEHRSGGPRAARAGPRARSPR